VQDDTRSGQLKNTKNRFKCGQGTNLDVFGSKIRRETSSRGI
jgi:hypothetical protein